MGEGVGLLFSGFLVFTLFMGYLVQAYMFSLPPPPPPTLFVFIVVVSSLFEVTVTYNNLCCLFSGFCHHLQAKELACPWRSVQQILLSLTHPSKSTETTNQPNKRSASWRTALAKKVARKNWKIGRDILKLTAYHSAIWLGVFSLGLKSTKYGKRLCWAGVINVPFSPVSVYLCCECL